MGVLQTTKVLILDHKVSPRDGIHEREIDKNCLSHIFVGSHWQICWVKDRWKLSHLSNDKHDFGCPYWIIGNH